MEVLILGNVQRALTLTDELLEIVPGHQRALGNKVYYLKDIEKLESVKRKGDDGDNSIQSDQVNVINFSTYIVRLAQ